MKAKIFTTFMKYNSLLEAEKKAALIISQVGQSQMNLPNRYSSCQNSSNIAGCIQEIYVTAISAARSTCRGTAAVQTYTELNRALTALSSDIESLVRQAQSSDKCSRDAQVKTALKSSSIQLLDALAGVASSLGFSGALAGMALKILPALFSPSLEGDVQSSLRDAETSNEFNTLSCVWLKLQHRVLRCDSIKSTAQNIDPNKLACSDYLKGSVDKQISSIQELLDYFDKLSEKPTSAQDELNRTYFIKQWKKVYDSNMAHPISGVEVKTSVVFQELVNMLRQSPGHIPDLRLSTQVNMLKDLIKNLDEFDANEPHRVPSAPVGLGALSQFPASISMPSAYRSGSSMTTPKQPPQSSNSDINKILLLTQSIDFNLLFSKFHEKLGLAPLSPSDMLALISPDSAEPAVNSSEFRTSKLWTNNFINHFQEYFLNHLKKQSEAQSSAKNSSKEDLTAESIRLAQMCTFLSGMYLGSYNKSIPAQNQFGLNNLDLNGAGADQFKSLCKPVSCLSTVYKIPEKPEDKQTVFKSFALHQCSMASASNRLINEIALKLNSGENSICP